ncbi:MAG: ABC transporter ATP-binding protein, partial [Rhizobiaceae bacterium]
MSLLRVTDLHKSFGGVVATDGVDLEVERGELHAIIGPNGAGKTTLISQIAGRLKPDSGKVTLAGRDITTMPAHKRQSIGMTRSFQITSLIMDMSVADNVALAVQSKQGHSFRFFKAARKVESLQSEALAMLDSVGLKDRASDRARALSHGEHRQLEVAVALATGTDLML